jgi:uncharacterized pyridoxamine 5'-phosphate oxidase family protein
MSWKDALREKQKIVLATSSKNGKPHAIVVVSLGIIDGKILIGACLMKTTLKNIQENNKISIVTENKGEYFRIEGKASIFSSGKYFDLAYKRSNPPMPKSAIAISISEVYDLGKGKKVY